MHQTIIFILWNRFERMISKLPTQELFHWGTESTFWSDQSVAVFKYNVPVVLVLENNNTSFHKQ